MGPRKTTVLPHAGLPGPLRLSAPSCVVTRAVDAKDLPASPHERDEALLVALRQGHVQSARHVLSSTQDCLGITDASAQLSRARLFPSESEAELATR